MAKYIVRFGGTRSLGVFSAGGDSRYDRGTRVIVRTDRGLEAGEVLCEASPRAVETLKNPMEGPLLRPMTADDHHELLRIQAQSREEFTVCQRCIAESGLEMELVDVEHVFGGERIVVYYLADGRIDFRQLVKTLAGEFQTRIEMRQIGVRDEAKLLADFGDCGQPVCCNTYLVEMPPVSMKMAKLQKATLDPTKISGRCGRLKCCLRYEYDTYEALQKGLPPLGTRVSTPSGRGRVLSQEVLAQQLLVEMDDRRRIFVPVADAQISTAAAPPPPERPAQEPPRGQRPRRGRNAGSSARADAPDEATQEPVAAQETPELASPENNETSADGPPPDNASAPLA